jgi:hypothetical protein
LLFATLSSAASIDLAAVLVPIWILVSPVVVVRRLVLADAPVIPAIFVLRAISPRAPPAA